MNNDLISRSALIREIDYWLDRFSNDLVKYALFKKARDIITNAPTAAPEVYGRWVYFTKETDEGCDTWRCSVCGARFVTEFGFEEQDFCPNCGARMDGGERMKPKMKTREICQYIPCGQTEFCEHECYIKRLEDENARMKAEYSKLTEFSNKLCDEILSETTAGSLRDTAWAYIVQLVWCAVIQQKCAELEERENE